jgi:hypothetical protein
MKPIANIYMKSACLTPLVRNDWRMGIGPTLLMPGGQQSACSHETFEKHRPTLPFPVAYTSRSAQNAVDNDHRLITRSPPAR